MHITNSMVSCTFLSRDVNKVDWVWHSSAFLNTLRTGSTKVCLYKNVQADLVTDVSKTTHAVHLAPWPNITLSFITVYLE